MVLTKEKKEKIVNAFKELIDKSRVVGLLNMSFLPAKQLQKIKKELRDTVQIKMSRKRLINLAISKSKKSGLKKLDIDSVSQPALIFSDIDSFKLFSHIKKRKMPAPAKEGAIVPKDVYIEEGPTDLPPGPAMSEIQKLGIKTKVEKGKIVIQSRKKVLNAGDVISKDVANVLNKLGIEPLEIGLDVVSTYENGQIFTKEILDIDEKEYFNKIVDCAQKAFNLSVNAGIPTKDNIEFIIQSAFQKAKNLGINAEIMDKDIVGDLIAKAVAEAKALESQLDFKVPENEPAVEETKKKVEEEEKKEIEKKGKEQKAREKQAENIEEEKETGGEEKEVSEEGAG